MGVVKATATSTPEPDAGQVVDGDWPQRPFPAVRGDRGKGFQVVCRRSVLQAIHRHGRETLDREVCGVLVGNVYHDETGPFLYVEACIRGEHAANLAAQVTFTSETWTHIHERMEDYPGQRILGWYHTHPDFGIFLSAADLFIHENFFNLPWQLAYVLDPVRNEEGLFVWRQGKATRGEFLIEEDAASKLPSVNLKSPTTVIGRTHQDYEALGKRVRRLERRVLALCVALLAVAALALVWPEVWPRVQSWLDETAEEQVEAAPGPPSGR